MEMRCAHRVALVEKREVCRHEVVAVAAGECEPSNARRHVGRRGRVQAIVRVEALELSVKREHCAT